MENGSPSDSPLSQRSISQPGNEGVHTQAHPTIGAHGTYLFSCTPLALSQVVRMTCESNGRMHHDPLQTIEGARHGLRQTGKIYMYVYIYIHTYTYVDIQNVTL